MQTGEIVWIDNLSIRQIDLASLFSSISDYSSSVDAEAEVTVAEGTQAGLVTNLDNASPHVNFLLTYTDGTNIYLDKVVAGIYTNLILSLSPILQSQDQGQNLEYQWKFESHDLLCG